MPLLELIDLKKEYFQGELAVVALNNINLTVENGEFLSIMGTSGSGLSLIHILTTMGTCISIMGKNQFS